MIFVFHVAKLCICNSKELTYFSVIPLPSNFVNSKSWNWKDLVVSSFEVSVVDAIAKHLKCLNLCYRKSL